MGYKKVTFKNKNNEELYGKLELPANQQPHNYVIFAHCFTGSKDFLASVDITRALSAEGYGVLRFDFTGLGESEGEFSETTFSHNIDDLVAAANFLSEIYLAPTLLIGHSFGGIAAIYASSKIKSIRAVATISSPSDPAHVKHLFKSNLQEIRASGKAIVNVGGRDFTIKKSFLDDLNKEKYDDFLQELKKPILIMHSPQDSIVNIKNAEELYVAAKHPKSFVSLDGANHLLTEEKDATYAGKICATWAKRYLKSEDVEDLKSKHQVMASLEQSDGFTTKMKLGNHYVTADEPKNFGGKDFGPNPYELVSAGLSACTAMTLQMYAKRKKWDLEKVEVHTNYHKEHAPDCEKCEDKNTKIDTFDRGIKLQGKLDEKQKERLLQIAEKCPVHKTLASQARINTWYIKSV